MATVNKVILLGNAGKDAKQKETGKGTPLASFSLATHRNRKNANDEWEQIPEWHSVICYGAVAEAASRVAKGNLVYVEGRIQKNDSEQAFDPYFVVATKVTIISKPQGRESAQYDGDADKPNIPVVDLDDLPF
jgi:single stranded DNA-binding protein